MTDAAEIVRLAERVEQATGPDLELDGWIWWMTGELAALCPETADMPAAVAIGYYSGMPPRLEESELTVADVTPAYKCPAYTASLDAAMTLLDPVWGYEQRMTSGDPSDCWAEIWWVPEFPGRAYGKGPTPALALTAAALKARARAAQHDHEVG